MKIQRKKLHAFLKKHKVTNRELAYKTDHNENTVRTWLDGTRNPSIASAIRIFDYLKTFDPNFDVVDMFRE